MSKHHKNNSNNKYNNNNEIEKVGQKGQVGHKPNGSCNDGSCDSSMKKGAAQGEHNKPMQQGKPAQGNQSGQQKPEHSQNKSESFKKNK